MKLKILHVIPRLAISGGIENYVRTLHLQSFPEDYNITICTFLNKCTTPIKGELLNKNINIIHLKRSWFEKVDNRLLRFFLKNSFSAYFNKLLSLKKILNDEEPDLLIAHGEDSELIAAFTSTSVKKVNVVHGESYFPANPFYRFLLYSFARKRYDFTIVVNKRLTIIPEKSGVKYAIVKPGINLERFNTAKHQIDLQDGSVKIGFIGRVVKEKGVFELLEAFSLLKVKYKNLQLFYAGEGKSINKLKNEVLKTGLEDDIIFLDEVKTPSEFYNQIDIFILPSLSEGLPVTILEAMASGVIVIASNVGGIQEVIKNEQNGLLLESCKPEVIANTVEILINNPVLCKEIVSNAIESIKNYSAKKFTDEFYSTINKM